MRQKVLIFIVSCNADTTITHVLSRIPTELFHDQDIQVDVLIIDDGSTDNTIAECHFYSHHNHEVPLTILVNPQNLGYGANQKLGYHYAIPHSNVKCTTGFAKDFVRSLIVQTLPWTIV